jgi:hypothetical protein
MPRSGTKLLRDLLNRHPRIGIPIIESHIIPFMVRRFGNPPNLSQTEAMDEFYQILLRTAFIEEIKDRGKGLLPREILGRIPNKRSWSAIFETILRFYAPPGKEDEFIWGDKTPGYLNHMLLLQELFPSGRFLHIIRDPRDYALSVQQAWNKSLYRAAYRWRNTLEKVRHDSAKLGSNYMEIYFESLLDNPEQTLRRICDYLGCSFISVMTTLERPPENLGDARGELQIIQSNKEKYLDRLSSRQIKRIEEIVYPVIESGPYCLQYANTFRSLSATGLTLLKLYDGWASARFHASKMGFRDGLSYFFRFYRESSWR